MGKGSGLRLGIALATLVACNQAALAQGNAPGGAVELPGLIIDLFPNGSGPRFESRPTSPPPAPAAAAPQLPNVPPVAISGEFVPDEVLVTIEGDAAQVSALAAAYGLEIRSQRTSRLLGSTLVRLGIPDGRPVGTVLAQLGTDARPTRRAPNAVYTLQQAAGSLGYAFGSIALDPETASGESVSIAVIDTAIDDKNPALQGVISVIYDAMPDIAIKDRDHATSVAGLIAGTGSFRGMAPGAQIFHARAFEGGKSNMDIILDALDWAASQNVRIINMSFVGPDNDLLREASDAARAEGMILVGAAGNNGPGAPFGYPAAYPGVIAVTAIDEQRGLMPQANRGPYVFVAAPGVNVPAPIQGGTDLVTGTSFAAAVVSGAIANLLKVDPARSGEDIARALSGTAHDLGPAGLDDDFGHGLIDTAAARTFR